MSFALELALDRIEAALAAELPAHVAAYAHAYAAGTPTPPAPDALTDARTLAVAGRALAATDPAIAWRGRRLWRQCALLVIERDIDLPRAGGWAELCALAAARDAAARRRWGRGFLAIAHDVFEVGVAPSSAPAIGRVAPAAAPPLTAAVVLELWRRLTDRRPPRIIVGAARSRAFAVSAGEAIVVIRAEPTVAAWSNALHELGHVLADPDLARTGDEAQAIATARELETTLAPDPSVAAGAVTVHARQRELAVALAAVERSLYAGEPMALERPPPWALFHDPGAQAAYAAAHGLARSVRPASGQAAETPRPRR